MNYLGHNFVEFFSNKIGKHYVCLVCKIQCHVWGESIQYHRFGKNLQTWLDLDVTCDEIIIKDIIE